MRPVRLEVEGFTVFRSATAVDFSGTDLFALVGPTGAGKTSIIDALTFALYGSVPRLDDRRAVAPVICRGRVDPEGTGARIRAEIRPSRQWLWFPAIGTLLFFVQLALAPPTGMALVGYAVVIGILWAVNLLAAAMPVGSDPVAEARALEQLIAGAAGTPAPRSTDA